MSDTMTILCVILFFVAFGLAIGIPSVFGRWG